MATPFMVPAEPRTRAEIGAGTTASVEKRKWSVESSSDLCKAACRASGVRTVRRQSDGGDPSFFQADSQSLAAFFQPSLQCAQRPAELSGRFVALRPDR